MNGNDQANTPVDFHMCLVKLPETQPLLHAGRKFVSVTETNLLVLYRERGTILLIVRTILNTSVECGKNVEFLNVTGIGTCSYH